MRRPELDAGRRAAVLGALGLVLALPEATASAEGLDEPWPGVDPIVGGVGTVEGELDAVVSIRTANQLCTGSLMTPTVVMTAAHCLDEVAPGSSVTVQLGADGTSERSVISDVFGIHPQYCEPCVEERYDFAYIELPEPQVPMDGYLEPIVSQFEWDEAMQLGNVVLVSGFGTNDPLDQTVITNPTKRKVTTTITDFTSQGFEFFAGGTGRDSCSGDSGGPAIVQLGNGIRRLAGVTSRGKVPCGDGGWYGVPYASLLWLQTQTGAELGCLNCLDTRPKAEDEGCAVSRPGPLGPWMVLVGLLGLRVRRAPRRRAP